MRNKTITSAAPKITSKLRKDNKFDFKMNSYTDSPETSAFVATDSTKMQQEDFATIENNSSEVLT